MQKLTDLPAFKPGDKVRAIVNATVIEAIPLLDGAILLDLAYESNGHTAKCAFPLDAPSVTVVRTDMDTKPISVLDFPVRISNILRSNGICTVGELVAKRPEDLKDLPNFGDACLAEVMATLGEQEPPLALKPTDIPVSDETYRVLAEYAANGGWIEDGS